MTLIVHGRADSSNVQAVMWGAAELGLAVERRDVGGRFGGTDTPEYRAMNPFGLVPVLEDGDTVMFESAAILRYLIATYDPDGRLATTPRGHSWAEWAKLSLCTSFMVPVFWAYDRTPEAERNMPAVDTALRGFESLAAIAMEARGVAPYLMGEALSLPDIWIGPVLYRYFTLDLTREVPAGLDGYYARLCARDAYCAHVMIDYSDLKGRLSF